MTRETDRAAALAELLETAPPDAFDCWRTHHRTQDGDPARFARLSYQAVMYQTHVLVQRENECGL